MAIRPSGHASRRRPRPSPGCSTRTSCKSMKSARWAAWQFFALEFVAGGSLATRLAGQPLPPRDAARLVAALAEAMHLAHRRNLVHRDLKPGNVLLVGEADTPVGQCQPKVTDFGLVRQLDADSGQNGGRHGDWDAQLHGSRAGRGPGPCRRTRRRRVCPGRHPLRVPDGPAAVPGGHTAGDPGAGSQPRASRTVCAESASAARPGDDLPEMPAQRAGAALFQCPGIG